MAVKEFVMQTVADLNLNIFELSERNYILHKLDLTIHRHAEINFCGHNICLAVIGESHFLFVKGKCLELLACTNLSSGSIADAFLHKKITGNDLNGASFLISCHGFKHSISCQFIQYDPNYELAEEVKPIMTMIEEFPFEFKQQVYNCRTQLKLSVINDFTLQLKTAHDYPQPDQVTVLTKSLMVFN